MPSYVFWIRLSSMVACLGMPPSRKIPAHVQNVDPAEMGGRREVADLDILYHQFPRRAERLDPRRAADERAVTDGYLLTSPGGDHDVNDRKPGVQRVVENHAIEVDLDVVD
jgi:hypothetical protein